MKYYNFGGKKMNNKLKAAVAAATALAIGSASIVSVSAETYKVQVNCPYMTLTVRDSDDKIPVGLELKLTDSEGTTVAEWAVEDEKNAYVSENVLNISGGMNRDSIYSGDYSFDISDYITGIGEDDIISAWLEDSASSVIDPAELKVGESYDLKVKYKDETAMEGTDLTVPAGNYYIAVDEKYENRIINCYIAMSLPNQILIDKLYNLNNDYGKLLTGQYDPGEYQLSLGCTDSGTSFGSIDNSKGWILNISESPTEYKKVEFNISEIDEKFDPDGTFWRKKDEQYDLKTGMLDGRRCDFYFVSGSVITAAIPDENGNVSVYVNKNDKMLGLALHCNDEDDKGHLYGWYKKLEVESEKTAAVIDTSIKIPTGFLTLYDIPAGEYTVTTDSTEYSIENDKIEISDTKDLQMLEVKVKKQSDNSSQSSEPDDSNSADSSTADTSSDTDSFVPDSSTADTSSDTDSSAVDSDISSLTDSTASQKGNSSAASSSSAAKNDSNPNTGAAAGSAAVLTVIGGAVVTVIKKKNK